MYEIEREKLAREKKKNICAIAFFGYDMKSACVCICPRTTWGRKQKRETEIQVQRRAQDLKNHHEKEAGNVEISGLGPVFVVQIYV